MKLITTTLFAFVLFPIMAFSQSNTFNWNDSSFYVGSKRIIRSIVFGMDYAGMLPSDSITMDTIANFLKKNPNLKVEISEHTDQRGSYRHNIILTQAWARCIVYYLIDKNGIDSARLVPKGYGFTRPIISMTQINKLKTQREKDSAYAINRRVEVTILATDYGHKTFNWNDNSFYVGSKRIIRTIYFGLDGAGLIPGDTITLDTIAKFLRKNPNLVVEITNHTDQQGSYRHNLRLSQARAQCVVNYLISEKSIDSARLVAKGYGFNMPLITIAEISKMKTREQQEAAYQVNRRFEITILSTDYKKP